MQDIDLLTPAQDALFAALEPIAGAASIPEGLSADLGGLRVFQHVPEDTAPPYIVLGNIESTDQSCRDEQASEIMAEVITVWRGHRRRELLWMMHQVRRQLNNQPIAAAGAVFTRPTIGAEKASEAINDGVTYVGLSTFTFTAQPA
jgi:hypothetical protein